MKFYERPAVHLVLITFFGLIAYSNTFDVPFQWDEYYFIKDNPIVKNLVYFIYPSEAKSFEGYHGALKNRYVGYLTFALNYKCDGFEVTGYHIFNIFLHIINALVVYFFIVLTFETPFLNGAKLKVHSKYIAFFAGLFFVAHPIQTEAVTYIFQRLVSLTAFFYMLSLVLYAKWRRSTALGSSLKGRGLRGGWHFYLLSLLSAILAMKTKENAFTLPVMILFYEFFFFCGSFRDRILGLIPFLATLLIIPLTAFDIKWPETISSADAATGGIQRWTYFFTQIRVIVTYLRLLFFPINQNIDYSTYPISHTFFAPEVIASAILLSSIIIVAANLFRLSRRNAGLRLAAFGIIWWFITLSVESSIIPLPRVASEYRIYLPSVGLIVATLVVAFTLSARGRKSETIIVSLCIVTAAVLSCATYMRNSVWASHLILWRDTVYKSPESPIAHRHVGLAYAETGDYNNAIKHGEKALVLKSDWPAVHLDLGVAFKSIGDYDNAIKHYILALSANPNSPEAYINLGNVYSDMWQIDSAIEYYNAALKLNPNAVNAHYNLGVAFFKKGDFVNAKAEFERVLKINPADLESRRLIERIAANLPFE